MDVQPLLDDFAEFARVDVSHEAATVELLLQAAARDVCHAAGIDTPEDAGELPADLRLAVLDVAARSYDERADGEGRPGLTVLASRAVARYRGVSLGVANINGEPEGAA